MKKTEKPIRVCMISPAFPPDYGWDGAARQSYELALGLKELGVELNVVALSNLASCTTNQDGMEVSRVTPSEGSESIRIVGSTTPGARIALRSNFDLWKEYSQISQERLFDVVESPGSIGEALFPGMISVAPMVLRLRGRLSWYLKHCFQHSGRSAFGFDDKLLLSMIRLSALMSDEVIAPDTCLFRDNPTLPGIEYAGKPPTIIPESVDARIFSPTGESALPREADRKTILFVAKLADREGQNLVTQAVSELIARYPNCRIILLPEDGVSDAAQKDAKTRFRKLVKEPADLHFFFKPARTLLPLIYRCADICVVQKGLESAPYGWLDPMACGVPVIAQEEERIFEFVEHEKTGLVFKSSDTKALISGIMHLIEDKAKSQDLSRNARASVEANFDNRLAAQKTLAVYRSVIDRFHTPERAQERARALHKCLSEFESLALPYDKMLYDLLYSKSWRFRIKHWMQKRFASPVS